MVEVQDGPTQWPYILAVCYIIHMEMRGKTLCIFEKGILN